MCFLGLLLITCHISILLNDEWALYNNRAVLFKCSDGPPQSWDDDPANFSILLGVWVSNHHLLQIACGYILGLYKAPDVYSHGSIHSTMRML